MNINTLTEPSVLLALVTVAISIKAFFDYGLLEKLMFLPYSVVRKRQWYRVITHAFIHADWMHLLFNMLALWSFGGAVSIYFGLISDKPHFHFYIMYFAAIVIASLPDIIQRKNDQSYRSLGASGAVSAVVFSAIFFDPWSKILIFFFPCPGILFGVLYLIYSSYMSKKGGDNINHSAHFYGAIWGFIYPILINPDNFQYFLQRLLHPTI